LSNESIDAKASAYNSTAAWALKMPAQPQEDSLADTLCGALKWTIEHY